MTAPSSEDSHYYIISESQYKKIQDIALLLKAVNIPFFTKQTAEHTTFFIPAEYSAKAKEELALFTKENASWPNVLELWSSAPLPFSFLHEVTIVLLAFFYGVVGQTRYEDWVNQGAVSAAHVLEGEWGRIFTGLTLHADIFHILFNLFFLWIFLHLLGQVIGNGTAWFFVLLSGGLA